MPRTPRFQVGPSTAHPTDLAELERRIDALSDSDRQNLRPIFDRVAESFRLRTRIMNVAKEALETIRLEMSFLRFDLEATRREKESLEKKMGEE